MKKKLWIVVIMVSTLALLAACGGSPAADPAPSAPEAAAPVAEAPPEEAEPAPEVAPEEEMSSDFPLPDDAENLMDLGDGAINFQTSLSIPDVVTFYRFAFPDYMEREILTVVEDASLNLVFDGHASGKAIVIQGFPMGEGVNVSIRFEDV